MLFWASRDDFEVREEFRDNFVDIFVLVPIVHAMCLIYLYLDSSSDFEQMNSWTKKHESKFYTYLSIDLVVYFLIYLYLDQIINNGKSPLFLISWIWEKKNRPKLTDDNLNT